MEGKNKVGRPKKIVKSYTAKEMRERLFPKVKYGNLSIPLKIAFVFSWSMIAVLVVLTIRSFM